MTSDDIDFGLGDEEYWTAPRSTGMAVARQLWAKRRDVTVVGAPSFVPLDIHETLPVVVYRAASFEQVLALDFDERAVITAVNLVSKRVYVGRLVVVEAPEPTQRVPGPPPDGNTSVSAVVDVRARLGLPWEPSTYLITVVFRDMLSNRARVELGPSPGSYRDPEVERFIAASRRRIEPPTVSPKPDTGGGLPSYHPRSGWPEVPREPGIELVSERVAVLRPGLRAPLTGAFRLPVDELQLVKQTSAFESSPIKAVVPITLVVTASDDSTVSAMTINAPSYLLEREQDQVFATGHFGVDLLATGLLRAKPQTYFVYALSGETLVGPTFAALVSEARISG